MRPAGRRTTRGAIVRALAGSSARGLRLALQSTAALADAAFDRFVQSLWPDAQQLGVSRATFDAATRGLEPDLTLPDLVIPGRPDRQPAQAEFVQTPAEYLKESAFDAARRAGPRKLAEQHRATLAQIEQRFGVPGRHRAGDLGARDRLRRGEDCRTARSARSRRRPISGGARTVPRGVPARAEDAAGGPRHAREHALLLGRRDGAAAVPAVGLLQVRDRFRRRRQARHLDLGAGCARHHRRIISSSSAGSAASAGPTR